MNTNEVEVILNNKNIYYEKEFRIKELNKRIDYYLPNYNLMFEFDGVQHHYPVDYFNGIEGYISDNENDARNTIWCIENGYQFVRLNHLMNTNMIVRILNYFIDGNDMTYVEDNVDNIVDEYVNNDKDKIFEEFYQFELKNEKTVYLLKCLSMLNKFATQLFNKEKDYFTREELDLYLKDKDYIYNGYSKINHNYDYLYENSQLKYAFNNSAYSFVLSITKDDIVNHTVRDVKNQYKAYCEENELKELGPSKFNPEIVKAFNVEQKSIKYKNINLGIHDHHAFENKIDNSNKTVKAWVEA